MSPPLRLALALILLAAPAQAAESIDAVIAAGRCQEAIEAAEEGIAETPERASLWRLLGDGHRCRAQARPAVLAYSRYLELQGVDPDIRRLVDELRTQLGRLVITLPGAPERGVFVQAEAPDEEPETLERQPDGTWLAADRAPGQTLTVRVEALGFAQGEWTSTPIPFGGDATLVVPLEPAEPGSLELSRPTPPQVRVEVLRMGDWTRIGPTELLAANAGTTTVALESEQGRVETSATVRSGQVTRFDPNPWLPTAITVHGAPAGAQIRIFLDAVEPPLERVVDLPPGLGELDPSTGIQIAPPHRIDRLVGGSGSLVLSHPTLGLLALEPTLVGGDENAVQVDASRFPNAGEREVRTTVARNERANPDPAALTPVIVGLAAGAAGLIASAAAWGGAAEQDRLINEARGSALAGLAHPDGEAGWFEAHRQATQAQEGLIGAAAVSATVGVAGFTIAGVFGARAAAQKASGD